MGVTVTVGQPVIIVGGYRKKRDGTVVKVARVWIEIQPDGTTDEWARQRFRLDDQTDGSKLNSPPRFYTLSQWAEKQRRDDAAAFLHEHGISIEYSSARWKNREVELADIIRAHLATQASTETPEG